MSPTLARRHHMRFSFVSIVITPLIPYSWWQETNLHPPLQVWVFQLQYLLLEDSILYHDRLCHTVHKAHSITFSCPVLNIGDGDFALGLTWPSLKSNRWLLFEESRILWEWGEGVLNGGLDNTYYLTNTPHAQGRLTHSNLFLSSMATFPSPPRSLAVVRPIPAWSRVYRAKDQKNGGRFARLLRRGRNNELPTRMDGVNRMWKDDEMYSNQALKYGGIKFIHGCVCIKDVAERWTATIRPIATWFNSLSPRFFESRGHRGYFVRKVKAKDGELQAI
jgi:hypothetical protein